jgi:UMF1 family MFS transporter
MAALLQPGVRRRELFGWAMYDFANSGYTTVVITAVYNAYFVAAIAPDPASGTLLWTLLLGISNAMAMLLMPLIGAHADRHGSKKRWLALATALCVGGTVLLALTDDWRLAALALVLSNLGFACSEGLIAAFLPELARREALGRVSGWGWAFGYVGGMLALGLCLAHVLAAQAAGQKASSFVPVTLWITAGLFLLAALPTFVLLRERPQPGSADRAQGFGRLRAAWQTARAYPDFRALLACALAYQAGIAVVIALAAIYAQQVLGFGQAQTMALIFLVNIASSVGAFGFGHVEDRVGHQRALSFTLLGWVLMVGLAYLATSAALFWVAALIAGLCMGSSQSCGRALAGSLAPRAQLAEFYGLWTLAVRGAAILGPITYGLVTWLTAGNHRLAIVSTGLFFVAGWWLLKRVDVVRGEARALQA